MTNSPVPHIQSAYAQALGMTLEYDADDWPLVAVGFGGNLVGRPGTLHGGAISGALETAGYAALRHVLASEGRTCRLKPINITIQFLRSGKSEQTWAMGRVTRLGRRTANVTVAAWQEDRDRPIATAVMNILIAQDG